MNLKNDRKGITPTPEFIAGQHTGNFVNILPDTFIIKGAKNDRGFDQAYALRNNNKEYILIDAVELATKEAVEGMVKGRDKIAAIIITGESVLKDAYADLETISEDAGGADIYIHPNSSVEDNFATKDLTANDALIKSFNLEIYDQSSRKNAAVLVYSGLNGGMLFTGDRTTGSDYDNDWSTFEREKLEKTEDEFEISKKWSGYDREFSYLFPRKGKPAIEVDAPTRTEILDKLSRGVS